MATALREPDAAGALLTSPLRITCAACCLSILVALSWPLTLGFSGALACTLPFAVSWKLPSPLIGSAGQPQACRIFSGTPRPFKLRLTWRCGNCDTAAVACRMPRSVKALSSLMLTVEAFAFSFSDGRRTSRRLKVAAAALRWRCHSTRPTDHLSPAVIRRRNRPAR